MKNQKQTQSSSPRVAVTSISFCKSAILREELKRVFPNCYFNERGQPYSGAELVDFLKDADAAVVGIESINDHILCKTPHLKIISKYGVGLDSIDQESLKRRNIALGWTGGVNRRSVSELTLCFMLGLCRNIFGSGYSLKQLKWEKEGGWQLTGKTVGIVGCGHVGSDVIQLLTPLQCTLLVCDIVDKSKFCQKHNATQTSLENLIAESDVVSLHVPLTSLTAKMVDQSFLDQMKPTAYLVNTSRGNVVDQQALKTALKNNDIAGAALDVLEKEPPSDKEFISLPNLMVTPHIGGNAREAVEAMGRSAIAHLITFFKNPQTRG
jgi:phosphoglycerate dehydrogenase-like enzyme